MSITRYIPNKITPRQQYRLSKNGDQANNENIPRLNIARHKTIIIPHLVVKSSLVNIAYTESPTTIAKILKK